jgi:hypothetical protein
MRHLSVALPALALSALMLCNAAAQNVDSQRGYASIRVEDLQKHLAVLSSDSLEGRETATDGQRRASAYIASVFHSLGLTPAGDEGSYFQNFDVAIRSVDPRSSILISGSTERAKLVWGQDFLASTSAPQSQEGPLVFIGYLDAPLDSLQKLTLQNAFVLAFAGKRSDAQGSYSSRARRRFFRQFPGSLGTIVIVDEKEGETFEALTSSLRGTLERGSMSLPDEKEPQRGARPPVFFISMGSATRVLQSTGKDASAWRLRALSDDPLGPVTVGNTTMAVDLALQIRTATTQNVVGLIKGKHTTLRDQFLVLSAHYDHLGRSQDGEIYRGADDDGSGTAMLLELAEAYTLNPTRPDRSILFVAMTGEEKGLLGSEYYVSHPVRPLDRSIANLNIDMIGRIDERHAAMTSGRYVYVIGSDKISTELDSLLQHVNQTTVRLDLDYTYNDERDPNQFYRRSDHYNFARHGIPVVFFFSGIHEDYHRVTDTIDKIRFDKMVPIGQLIYQTGWELSGRAQPLEKRHPVAP